MTKYFEHFFRLQKSLVSRSVNGKRYFHLNMKAVPDEVTRKIYREGNSASSQSLLRSGSENRFEEDNIFSSSNYRPLSQASGDYFDTLPELKISQKGEIL